MRVSIAFLLTAATLWGCSPAPEPVEVAVPVEERVERIVGAIRPALVIAGDPVATQTLTERLKHHDVPGVSIAVVHEGKLEWVRGFGLADVESERAVTPETLFQAGSVSKPVAALSALRLAQEGKLDLSADVNGKLTSWQIPANDWTGTRPVTPATLLSHTAGTTVHGFPGYPRDEARPSTVDVLDGKGNTDPVVVDFEPGSEWRYSGGGYTVMQLLVSDVAGRPFADVMRTEVLLPLGMEDSTYEQPLPEALHHRAAAGYRSDGSRVAGDWHVYPEMAAAGLWTTPTDLAGYIMAIQRARAGRGDGVLTRETVDEMLVPVMNGYGLGPGVDAEYGRFTHGGVNNGFECRFTGFYDEGEGVVVMTNSNNGLLLVEEIILTVATEYGWPGFEPVVKTIVKMDAGQLGAFAGRFEIEGYGVLVLSVDGRGLLAELPDGERATLLPESETVFFDPDDGQMINFTMDDDRVSGFRVGGTTAKRLD
jgi:CubicO group peptidase (beta-lactamase class C family)